MLELLVPLIFLALALWLWREGLRAREAAISACSRACRGENVQLLDQTVALVELRPVWSRGRPRLRRVYAFEFSRDGADRVAASATLVGIELLSLHMPGLERPPGADAAAHHAVSPDARRLH